MRALVRFTIVALLMSGSPLAADETDNWITKINAANSAQKSGDYASAFKLLGDLADQDSRVAQARLANMLERGEGTPPDIIFAYVLYHRVASEPQGWGHVTKSTKNKTADFVIEEAARARDRLGAEMTAAQLDVARSKADAWRPKTNILTPGPFLPSHASEVAPE